MRQLFCAIAFICIALTSAPSHADLIDDLLAGAELQTEEVYRRLGDADWGDWLARMVPIPALTGHERPFERSYALVIGISEFGDDLDPLPATEDNPGDIRELLIQQGFDVVITLTNERATKERIELLMKDVFPAMVGAKDRFLFYLSGHGVVQDSGEGYIPLTASDGWYSRMLAMRDVRTWNGSLRNARQVLFLLDTCFSGLAGLEPQSNPRNRAIDQLARKGHHLVTAATQGEQTIASNTFSGSIFTSSIIEAVLGGADQEILWDADGDGLRESVRDGVVSLYELLSHVRTQVAVKAEAVGWGAPITPHLYPLQASEGEFFFVTQEQVDKVDNAIQPGGAEPQGAILDHQNLDRDERIFETIKDSRLAADFERFLADYPRSIYAPFARNRLDALNENATVLPEADASAGADPKAVEDALIPRPEDRQIVQRALTDLGFETRGVDGIFGANTRRAIIRWQQSRGLSVTSYLNAEQYGQLLIEAERASRRGVDPEILEAIAEGRIEPAAGPPDRDAPYEPRDTFRDCAECPEMVVVPFGSFMMGSPEAEKGREDDEGPRHRVAIAQPFAIGVHEVTRGEFAAFVEATGHDTGNSCYTWEGGWKLVEGRNWRSPGFAQTDDHPVVCLSWDDAKAYVAWLSGQTRADYRLLSEAEWEYATRADSSSRRFWGNDLDDAEGCAFANGADLTAKDEFSGWTVMNCRDGYVHTAPVGTFATNDFGLHDPLGNAWEWVEDCWNDSYAGAPADGTAWTSGDCGRRVLRGGSWGDFPRYLRSAYRSWSDADFRINFGGFRVARTLGD